MLSPAQLYEFDLKGYVVLRGVLEPGLIERLHAALSVLEGKSKAELPSHCVPSWTPVINEYRLMGLLETDPVFEELIDRDEILHWVDEIVPKPYRLAEAYSITRLRGLGVPLHSQPEAKYRMTLQGPRTHLLKCAIALTDVGTDDGPMVIFEGSHKLERPWPFGNLHPDWRAPGVDPVFEAAFLKEQPNCDLRAWEDIPGYREVHVRAGDVILMSDDMWHGAKALQSDRRRRTLYYSYVPYHYPNWHGIDYSKELKARVNARRRKLLSGPFVGTRYANHDTHEIPDDLGFPKLPDSTRDPARFELFRGALAEPSAGPIKAPAALEGLLLALAGNQEMRGTCLFEVRGEHAGRYALRLAAGEAALVPESDGTPDTVVEIECADLDAIAAGNADPVQLFYEGRARARGDIRLAMRLVDAWLSHC